MNHKILIAYFSRAGNNYVGGSIVNLPVGNTEAAAKMIEQLTGGILFKIDPVNKYLNDYTRCTFLDRYDFTGKNILPLCTHEGSGMGHSENDIRKLCPGANVRKGLAIRGGSVKNAEADIERWLKTQGI